MNLLREFDLTYWRMMEALGYPIPDRIDRRFPRKLVGNCGVNPFECGKCRARKLFPTTNFTAELRHLRDTLPPQEWQELSDHLKKHVFDEPSHDR